MVITVNLERRDLERVPKYCDIATMCTNVLHYSDSHIIRRSPKSTIARHPSRQFMDGNPDFDHLSNTLTQDPVRIAEF